MSTLAVLSEFGATSSVIWQFAAGVLSVMLVAALVLMGVSLMKRLLE
jgi:hypothetical protein